MLFIEFPPRGRPCLLHRLSFHQHLGQLSPILQTGVEVPEAGPLPRSRGWAQTGAAPPAPGGGVRALSQAGGLPRHRAWQESSARPSCLHVSSALQPEAHPGPAATSQPQMLGLGQAPVQLATSTRPFPSRPVCVLTLSTRPRLTWFLGSWGPR